MKRLALALVLVLGCAPPPAEREADKLDTGTVEEAGGIFRDVTARSGIDFVHDHGGTGRKYLPEIMGAGGCALDYDGDGWLDLYLVQSGPVPGAAPAPGERPGNRLYRNLGAGADGRVVFEDVTAAAGVGDTGYGMGAVAGDVDNDGDADLYVVNFGPDVLLANDGDGTFTDVTRAAGIDSPLWGSSATFFDADGDGWLDLYVVNYLDFTVARHIDCGRMSKDIPAYCHPDVYDMAPDVYFRNRGASGGRVAFEEATRAAGLVDTTGKGLGVVAADLDGNGWTDLYVANDSTPNFLYQNRGGGVFDEVALLMGVGHNEEGLTEAGMGTDVGDVDGDGWLDLFVTNLSNETNALYLGGAAFFTYHTRHAGLYADTYLPVGFGTDLADLDNDGDLDLFVTNGHVIDNIEELDDAQTFRQPSQVFLNDSGGRFRLLTATDAGDVAEPRVGRGTVTLDVDHDGGLDLLVTYNNDRARLFSNVLPDRGAWIGFELAGGACRRTTVGTRLRLEAGGRTWTDESKTGSSYQTSGDPRVHFGLGAARRAERLWVGRPGAGGLAIDGLDSGRYYRVAGCRKGRPLS